MVLIREKLTSVKEEDENEEPISRKFNFLQDSTSRIKEPDSDDEEEEDLIFQQIKDSLSSEGTSKDEYVKSESNNSDYAKNTSNTLLLETKNSFKKHKTEKVHSQPNTTTSFTIPKSDSKKEQKSFKIRKKPKFVYPGAREERVNRSLALDYQKNWRKEKFSNTNIFRKPQSNHNNRKPLLLPEFLDKPRLIGKTDIDPTKINTRKITESLQMKQEYFKPSAPLRPFRSLTEPSIPKFALKLIKKLRPEFHSPTLKDSNSKIEYSRNQSYTVNQSNQYSNLYTIDSERNNDYVKKDGMSLVESSKFSKKRSKKNLRNSSNLIDQYELTASQIQLNNQMIKLQPHLVKFLELNDRHPDKNKTLNFVSNHLKTKSPFFSGYSKDFISQMLYISSIRFYPKDHVLFYPDDICDVCCIVVFGVLKTRVTSSGYTLSHGAVIGEEAVLRPHRTNIHKGETRTNSKCCLLEFSKDDFQEVKIFSESNRKKNDYILLISQIKKQFQLKANPNLLKS